MLHVRADDLGQGVKQNLADNECRNSETNVPQRPTLLQCADDQQSLHDDVNEEEDRGEDVDDHEEADRALRAQASPSLECEQSNDEADSEHSQTADAKQPYRQSGTVFVELETDEAVDHQADAGGANKAELHSNEVWVCIGSRWYNAAVDDERADGEEGVQVEESRDFLAACNKFR
jgi:hypothetical protein